MTEPLTSRRGSTRRRWIIAFAVVGALALALFTVLVRQLTPPAAQPDALDPAHAERAGQFLDQLETGAFDQAHALFDPKAAAAVDAEKLATIWTALPKQLGGSPRRGAARGEQVDGQPITTVPLHFPSATLDARFTFDTQLRITGFRLLPGRTAAAPAPVSADFDEREISVDDLPGTLTLPRGAGPFPAVVLVHGSGPQDRDGTIGPNRPFRELAHGLATRGIAVLRYDKRTLARPQDFADGAFTVDRETVDDALAAVDVLRTQSEIDPRRVFVLGHSLGALLAPRIASRAPELAGVILLAAPARPLDEVVAGQLAYIADLDGGRSAGERAAIDEFATRRARLQVPDGDGPLDGPLPLDLPAAYWRDLVAYDPLAVARTLELPMLVLAGGRDYQVPDADFARWQQALGSEPRATLRHYPRLNHLFADGDVASTPDEYRREQSVAAAVIADIAGWIDGH